MRWPCRISEQEQANKTTQSRASKTREGIIALPLLQERAPWKEDTKFKWVSSSALSTARASRTVELCMHPKDDPMTTRMETKIMDYPSKNPKENAPALLITWPKSALNIFWLTRCVLLVFLEGKHVLKSHFWNRDFLWQEERNELSRPYGSTRFGLWWSLIHRHQIL